MPPAAVMDSPAHTMPPSWGIPGWSLRHRVQPVGLSVREGAVLQYFQQAGEVEGF